MAQHNNFVKTMKLAYGPGALDSWTGFEKVGGDTPGTGLIGLCRKIPTFGFLFNFISIFETINKNTFFGNNLFIMVYKLLTTT